MPAGPYDIGDKVRVIGTFTDIDGGFVDPSVVTIKFKSPSSVVTTPTVVNESPGVYHADQSITAAGTWYYRVESTGTGQAAGEGQFTVTPSNFP